MKTPVTSRFSFLSSAAIAGALTAVAALSSPAHADGAENSAKTQFTTANSTSKQEEDADRKFAEDFTKTLLKASKESAGRDCVGISLVVGKEIGIPAEKVVEKIVNDFKSLGVPAKVSLFEPNTGHGDVRIFIDENAQKRSPRSKDGAYDIMSFLEDIPDLAYMYKIVVSKEGGTLVVNDQERKFKPNEYALKDVTRGPVLAKN